MADRECHSSTRRPVPLRIGPFASSDFVASGTLRNSGLQRAWVYDRPPRRGNGGRSARNRCTRPSIECTIGTPGGCTYIAGTSGPRSSDFRGRTADSCRRCRKGDHSCLSRCMRGDIPRRSFEFRGQATKSRNSGRQATGDRHCLNDGPPGSSGGHWLTASRHPAGQPPPERAVCRAAPASAETRPQEKGRGGGGADEFRGCVACPRNSPETPKLPKLRVCLRRAALPCRLDPGLGKWGS